jgi:PAS domain S-box-containing protein
MFIGLLNTDVHRILNVSLSLVSFILFNSANAIESFELYRRISEINRNLERIDNYRLLFEAAPDGVEVVDAEGNIIDSNDSQKKLLGYSQEQLTGSPSSDYFSEKSRASWLNNPSSFNENGYWEGEVELVAATGEIVPVWRKEKAIYDNDHRFIGAVIYNRDITNRKRSEEEKRSLQERLQRAEKMEALGTMAGGVAHDLNNVLGVVIGYSELLLMDADQSRSISPRLVNIMNGAQRAAAIVQDLLTLARRGVPSREVLNLNRIIVDSQESPEFERLFSFHSSVRIKTDLDPDLLNVSGSSVHLRKTLFNLVSNASEAMPKGGILTIKTANQYLDKPIQGYDEVRDGDYVVLSVSDAGEGMPAADLKRIFEPFYTKKVMGRSGTGLGLAVVWGTVKDHNGYINVQSEEGKGSIFTLYFPVTREDISTKAVAALISEYMGKGESILIVDDVKEQRDLAAEMLRKLNYTITSVSSGEEAVAYLMEHQADLMVLDMIMDPGMDGLDTYKKVLEIHPTQKAIIVSGFSETDRVITAHAFGAGTYVRKPYVIEKLGLAVRKELDRK